VTRFLDRNLMGATDQPARERAAAGP
jgi:hypothetical protein